MHLVKGVRMTVFGVESGRNKRRRKSSLVALGRAVARKGSVMASASFVSYLPICHGHGYRSEAVKVCAMDAKS